MAAVSRFCGWFSEHALRLRALPLREAADELSEQLKKVDAGLAIEMADQAQLRELVLSACGNPQLFELVRSIKSALGKVPSWLFTALKPARGFDFVLTTPEGGLVEAAELFFEPLRTDETPSRIVIRIFLPPEMVNHGDVEWMLRLAAEAGVGEEMCSHISFFEAASLSNTPDDALPIEVLGDYVAHVLKVSRN